MGAIQLTDNLTIVIEDIGDNELELSLCSQPQTATVRLTLDNLYQLRDFVDSAIECKESKVDSFDLVDGWDF